MLNNFYMNLENIETNHNSYKSCQELDLLNQVAVDLDNFLEKFPNKSLALKMVSRETGLHTKTLKRLLKAENRPTYQTLLKLYSLFLDCDQFDELLKKCPESVKEIIQESCPHEKITLRPKERNLAQILKESPVSCEFVVLAGLRPLSKNSISFRYGSFGLKCFQELVDKGILNQVKSDQFILNRSYTDFDAETMKIIGQYFLKMFCRTGEGQTEGKNLLGLYTECLNEKGLEEWLKIDTKAFHQKIKIAQNSKYQGHTPTFTLQATDTLIPDKS